MDNINTPVWYEDVQDQEEFIQDSWRSIYTIIEKLKHQGAPSSLVEEVVIINNSLAESTKKLASLKKYFPKEN